MVLGLDWLAPLAIAPAAYAVLSRLRPQLATGRLWFLLLLAPVSYGLNAELGLALRSTVAAAAGTVASALNPEVGAATGDLVRCGAHRLLITPECTGMRALVGMAAMGGVVAVLREVRRQSEVIILVGLGALFAVFANTVRIAGLCLVAPGFPPESSARLETIHDLSGLAVFVLAYALLAISAGLFRRHQE